MKITITQDFDTPEAAATFLARVGNPAYVAETLTTAPAPEKTRKPRADAGKTREPYGPRTTTGEPAASEPGNGGGASAPASQPAAPATPTTNAAPAVEQRGETASSAPTAATNSSAPASTGGEQKAVTPAVTSAAEEFPATLEGARKAMKALDQTDGKGMDACIGALKANGVLRISDLKSEQYAAFIKEVLDKSSEKGIKAAIEWSKSVKKAAAK